MAFTIPNLADAAFADQAQVDKVDLDILIAGLRGTGITSGAGVTTTGAGNGAVAVAAGEARIAHQLITVTANSALAIGANSTGNPRFDLVSVGTNGTPTVTAGTAAAAPRFPALPASHAALAVVRVPNGHGAGTTIPANTIVDKRVDLSAQLARDDRGAGEDFEVLVQQQSLSRVPFVIKGLTGLSVLFEIKDFLDAPIAWCNSAGGFNINDDLKTAYSTSGPYPFRADIWGYQWRGASNQCTFAFPGPPGNMLNWTSAVHEKYQEDRSASVGQWTVVGNCTLSTTQQNTPPAEYRTTYRSTMRITATATNPWIATNGGAFAIEGVVAGQVVSVIAYVRTVSAAAARNANVAISFYTSGGTQVGSDVNGGSVSVPTTTTGAFTKLSLDGTVVPATATRVQAHIKTANVNGEVLDVCGTGIMKNAQIAVFGPPFVAQNTTTGEGVFAEAGGVAGARWIRTDTPNIPGQREYTLGTTGLPPAQRWGPIDSASLYRLDADVASTSTTAAAVAPFDLQVDANGFYALDYDLFITTPNVATTGWGLGFTAPASPTNFFAVNEYQTSATAWATQTIQSATTFGTVTAGGYVASPNIIRVRIRAQLNNGANAGTLSLTWRSETAGSSVVIKRGSMLSVT